jgi:lactoylglutathione lyase
MQWTDGSEQHYRDNPVKLVLYVADPSDLARRIRDEGLEIVREPAPVPELRDAVVGFARDPDGYLIEILQR